MTTRIDLQSTAQLKNILGDYFRSFVGGDAPVAWCTSVGPAELLVAMGFSVFFPENHGAMLGASRMANACMAHAHARGYSPDICSYLTSDIGAYLGKKTPLQAYGLDSAPKADVLVYNTNQCRDVRDWFEFYGREWNVPVIGVTSPRGVSVVDGGWVDAMARQFEALVPPLESIAGHRLDAARLAEAMRLSRECSDGWKACLEASAHRPSPMTFFDATIQMAPAVLLRGSSISVEYYRTLHAELSQRIANGLGAVPTERFRLYWDGMPIWGKLSTFSRWLGELDTCVVASTYCNSWIFDALDPADPFRSMAQASLELFIARSEGAKETIIERMATFYAVDGIVFHDARTCPNNSNCRYGMPLRLRERLNLPVLSIDGDLNDLRCFSDEQTHTNLEGFVEQLDSAASTAAS